MSARNDRHDALDWLQDLEGGGEAAELALAAAAPETHASPDLFARIRGITTPGAALAGFRERLARHFDLPAAAADRLLAEIPGHARWVAGPAEGTRLFHLEGGPSLSHVDCGLVVTDPGAEFPSHLHEGTELSLILQGAVEQDDGAVQLPGDYVAYEAGSSHSYRSVGDEPLVYAVVLHDGIRILGNREPAANEEEQTEER
ncbi:MAG: cupin domain-containing protein [Myxococcota bacterium]|nr:cupin domain-containing protein [Myxococcota bacterium]